MCCDGLIGEFVLYVCMYVCIICENILYMYVLYYMHTYIILYMCVCIYIYIYKRLVSDGMTVLRWVDILMYT